MDKTTIVNEFDAKAASYENYRLGGWYIAQLQLLKKHLGVADGSRVLDIGCGTGWLIRTLASQHPGVQFVGVDISSAMVEYARQSLPSKIDNVEFLHADWELFDFEEGTEAEFDTVICSSAFHYFSDPVAALQRMRNAMRPGGLMYLIERSKSRSVLTAVWDLLHRFVIKDHVQFYSENELHSMLLDAGFGDIETLERIKKYFWYGKLQTNVAIVRARALIT